MGDRHSIYVLFQEVSVEWGKRGRGRLSVLSCSKPAQEWTPIPLQIQETDPTAESFRRDIPTPVTGRALPPRRPRRRTPLPLRRGTFQTIPRPGRLSALRLRWGSPPESRSPGRSFLGSPRGKRPAGGTATPLGLSSSANSFRFLPLQLPGNTVTHRKDHSGRRSPQSGTPSLRPWLSARRTKRVIGRMRAAAACGSALRSRGASAITSGLSASTLPARAHAQWTSRSFTSRDRAERPQPCTAS